MQLLANWLDCPTGGGLVSQSLVGLSFGKTVYLSVCHHMIFLAIGLLPVGLSASWSSSDGLSASRSVIR